MTPSTRPTLFLAALALFASTGALAETLNGSGTMATQTRAVPGFSALAIAVPGQVKVTRGNTESLTITADDNALPYIETVVEDGQLKVRFRKPADGHLNVNHVKVSITLVARNLEAIAISGSADITAGPMAATRFVVNIAGSGSLDVESVTAEDVSVRIAGSGDLAVRGGRTDSLDVRIGGSGNVKTAKLESKRAKVRIGGSGDASVWARDTLDVSVAGSGDVRYYGDPKVERKVAGSGDVTRLGASPS